MSLMKTMTSSLSREVVMNRIEGIDKSSRSLPSTYGIVVDVVLTLAMAMVYVGDSINAFERSSGKSFSEKV